MTHQDVFCIARALIELCQRFEACGLKAPVGVTLAPGEMPRLARLLSEAMPIDAAAVRTNSIVGVAIREEGI